MPENSMKIVLITLAAMFVVSTFRENTIVKTIIG